MLPGDKHAKFFVSDVPKIPPIIQIVVLHKDGFVFIGMTLGMELDIDKNVS